MKYDDVANKILSKYYSVNEEYYTSTPAEDATRSKSMGELFNDFKNFVGQYFPGKNADSLTPEERAEIGQAYIDAKQQYVSDQSNPRSPADQFGDQLRQNQHIARSAVEDTYEDERGPLAPDYEHLSVLAPETSSDQTPAAPPATNTPTSASPTAPPATQSPQPTPSPSPAPTAPSTSRYLPAQQVMPWTATKSY